MRKKGVIDISRQYNTKFNHLMLHVQSCNEPLGRRRRGQGLFPDGRGPEDGSSCRQNVLGLQVLDGHRLGASRDVVDKGKLQQRGKDEDGAAEEPNVQELDVIHLGQLVRARVVG